MLDSHNLNLNNPDASRLQKPGNVHSMKQNQETAQTERAVNWFVVQEQDGELKLNAVPNTYHVDVTSVSVYADEVSAPKELNVFGYKIDLKSKIDAFKDNYVKNYALTKSHNLMVARFAELKTAFFGQLLSLLGFASEDLRKLQKKAIEGSVKQNKALFEENEYNGELLAVVGGGSRKMARTQEKVIGEIRKQLITQSGNLGLGDHYSRERIIETQIEQCRKIMVKFQEEKSNLEYQLAYSGAN